MFYNLELKFNCLHVDLLVDMTKLKANLNDRIAFEVASKHLRNP